MLLRCEMQMREVPASAGVGPAGMAQLVEIVPYTISPK